MSARSRVSRVLVFAVLFGAGLGIAADHVAAARDGKVVAVRAGEAGQAGPEEEIGELGPGGYRYCGYAPCGMPILCPGQIVF